MTFAKFKRLVYSGEEKGQTCDPMTAWACIRCFIKGSIEAVIEPTRILSREKFLELGKKRCRLPIDTRKEVYDIAEGVRFSAGTSF